LLWRDRGWRLHVIPTSMRTSQILDPEKTFRPGVSMRDARELAKKTPQHCGYRWYAEPVPRLMLTGRCLAGQSRGMRIWIRPHRVLCTRRSCARRVTLSSYTVLVLGPDQPQHSDWSPSRTGGYTVSQI